MRKTTIVLDIESADDTLIDFSHVQKALPFFVLQLPDGSVSASRITAIDSYKTALADPDKSDEAIWLYASEIEEEGFLVASDAGEDPDEEFDLDASGILNTHVVDKFYAEYPRSDKYGIPTSLSGSEEISRLLGNFGMAVVPAHILDTETRDRGDDGMSQYWIRLVPAVKPGLKHSAKP